MGSEISGDDGAVLFRQADRLTGSSDAVCGVLKDGREKDKVKREVLSMLRQRMYSLALGYEDLNHQNSTSTGQNIGKNGD